VWCLMVAVGPSPTSLLGLTAADAQAQNNKAPSLSTAAKQKKPEKPVDLKNEEAPVPVLPAGEAVQASEFMALAHAKQAGVNFCTDTLSRLLPYSIDAPHEAFSFWAPSPDNPDDRLFGSIAGLRYAQRAAPRAVSVIAAVPSKAGKCDGLGVQIVSSARSCGALQASLLDKGRAVANLAGLPLIENASGQRFMLLPSAGNGCVVVAVNTMFGH